MTAQEKAKYIFSKMYQSPFVKKADAKRCALIAVDQVIMLTDIQPALNYWQQVKEEIENL